MRCEHVEFKERQKSSVPSKEAGEEWRKVQRGKRSWWDLTTTLRTFISTQVRCKAVGRFFISDMVRFVFNRSNIAAMLKIKGASVEAGKTDWILSNNLDRWWWIRLKSRGEVTEKWSDSVCISGWSHQNLPTVWM